MLTDQNTKNTPNLGNEINGAKNTLDSLLARSTGTYNGKAVSAFKKAVAESIGSEYGSTVLSKDELGLSLGAICFHRQVQEKLLTVVYIVEEEGVLGEEKGKEHGVEYRIPYVVSDLVNGDTFFLDQVTRSLSNKTESEVKIVAVSTFNTESQIEFSGETVNVAKAKKVAEYVGTAINSVFNDSLVHVETFTSGRDSKMVTSLSNTSTPIFTASGNPIHRDWSANIRIESNNNGSKAQLARKGVINLTELSGYNDFVFLGEEHAAHSMKQNGCYRTHQLNHHITDIRSLIGYNNLSLTILALTSIAPALSRNSRTASIRNFVGKGSKGDLMALNNDITDNKGARFDMAADNFSLEKFMQFYVADDFNVILHVPELQEDNLFLSYFAAAGRNSKHHQKAIYDTARQMFGKVDAQGNMNGSFLDDFFGPNDRIAITLNSERIINGKFNDEDDTLHDARAFTYMKARQQQENNHILSQYENTFNTNTDNKVRLSQRLAYLETVNPSLKVTGYSSPVLLEPKFIRAIAMAAKAAAKNNSFVIDNKFTFETTQRRGVSRGVGLFGGDTFGGQNSNDVAGGASFNIATFDI